MGSLNTLKFLSSYSLKGNDTSTISDYKMKNFDSFKRGFRSDVEKVYNNNNLSNVADLGSHLLLDKEGHAQFSLSSGE